jgi:hypothetical protein
MLIIDSRTVPIYAALQQDLENHRLFNALERPTSNQNQIAAQ